jgi:hypothetical protein
MGTNVSQLRGEISEPDTVQDEKRIEQLLQALLKSLIAEQKTEAVDE